MALRELDIGLRLGERFLPQKRVETIPFSQKVQAAISNFVEYPAGPWRQGSGPHNWVFPDWLDYQVQKMVRRNGK